MLKPNKFKSEKLRVGAEFTPSQLVIAICVFLCAALICFSLGVIVGKYDERNNGPAKGNPASSSGRPTQTAPPPPSDATTVPPVNPPPTDASAGQGVQSSPRTVVVPASPAKAPGYPESTGAVKAGPRISEHPAPQKTEKKTDHATQPAVITQQKPEKTTPQAAQPADSTSEAKNAPANPPENQAPANTPPQDADSALEPVALEPIAKTESPKSDPPAAEKKGLYTIQIAALSSPNRKEQALALKSKLEAQGLKPELLITKDGSRVSVVVGEYPDRPAAQTACNDLRKSNGFPDCFVRTR